MDLKGTPTMLGAASGAIAGLVAITPACGWVGPMGAIVIGLLAGLDLPAGGHQAEGRLGYDDSLDVFGVHCVGGILGALLTGVFNAPRWAATACTTTWPTRSRVLDSSGQFMAQLWGVASPIVWSGVVSLVGYTIVNDDDRAAGHGRTRSAKASTPACTASGRITTREIPS